MGCDIHSYVEVRNLSKLSDEKPQWRAIPLWSTAWSETPYLASHYNGRDYELFGWLTGGVVRCNTATILPSPKGLPTDVSSAVSDAYHQYEDSWHSCSYFTLEELKKAYKKIPKKIIDATGEKAKNTFRKRAKYFIDSAAMFADTRGWFNDEEIRVVFWFDS